MSRLPILLQGIIVQNSLACESYPLLPYEDQELVKHGFDPDIIDDCDKPQMTNICQVPANFNKFAKL